MRLIAYGIIKMINLLKKMIKSQYFQSSLITPRVVKFLENVLKFL